MLDIILFQPEIPQNTGNIGRLCAVANLRLHLIYPLGFVLDSKAVKRSGMDYWESLEVYHHADWEAFEQHPKYPQRIWMLSTRGKKAHWSVDFKPGDGLLFGNEGHGCPQWLHDKIGDAHRITLPQFNTEMRSLNLATSVGIASYEALRQLNT